MQEVVYGSKLESRGIGQANSISQSARGDSGASALAVVAGLAICAVMVLNEARAWRWMYGIWMTNPDNSHGLLVPAFSVVLLWMRLNLCPSASARISPAAFGLGLVLIISSAILKCVGIYCRTVTVDAVSIIPCLAGITLCYGGWQGARWAWPSVLFLVFMVPLPAVIGNQLGGNLQRVATIGSSYLMQLLGLPAIPDGNVIYMSHATLGVAQACSGIRMLVSFFALTAAICFVVERPWWEKVLILMSAPAIAVIANILRITATGIAHEYGSAKLADVIFHDFAGWLMMPIGLVLMWVELYVLARIFDDGSR